MPNASTVLILLLFADFSSSEASYSSEGQRKGEARLGFGFPLNKQKQFSFYPTMSRPTRSRAEESWEVKECWLEASRERALRQDTSRTRCELKQDDEVQVVV